MTRVLDIVKVTPRAFCNELELLKVSFVTSAVSRGMASLKFPPALFQGIETALTRLGLSFSRPKDLASAVMKLSSFYRDFPSRQTPWNEPWCQAAYLAYYLPLNFWRISHAVSRGVDVEFFRGFDHLVDFGSGLGSVTFAFDQHQILFAKGGLCLERSVEAAKFHKNLHTNLPQALTWQQKDLSSKDIRPGTLAVFSYSLTELDQLPNWVHACEGLMIVEPATQEDGRRLLKLRQELIDKGWEISAPCLHQNACPLLVHSERDWCHDRFAWDQPDWLRAVEQHMPIKNGTLPYSYLLVRKPRKEDAAATLKNSSPGLIRVTGDLQEFKGFAKQLICRDSEREFLSFQKKDFKKEYPHILRGDLLKISGETPKKGNELRPDPKLFENSR